MLLVFLLSLVTMLCLYSFLIFLLSIGGSGGDSEEMIKNMLYTDLSRAMGLPTPRMSYALVYINDIFMGLYFMHEVVNPDFMESRIQGDSGKGECSFGVYYCR